MSLGSTYQNSISENHKVDIHKDKIRKVQTDIMKTSLFKYIENFTSKKNENFQMKISDICHIFAQNIDCGYSLEPPRDVCMGSY